MPELMKRRPTHDEAQAILAHARQLRSQYLRALVTHAWRRVTRPVIGGGARDALAALYSEAR